VSDEAPDSESVLVYAPLGRDAPVLTGLLAEDGIAAYACGSGAALLRGLDRAGMAVVTEEALASVDLGAVDRWLAAQPPWSDVPFVILTTRGAGEERNPAALRQMRALGNVSFLERPFHPTTFVSVVRTALASRRRQYVVRDQLREIEATAARLRTSEERLSFALDAGGLGAWEIDLPSRTLRASDHCKRNFGRDPAEPFGYDELVASIHPDDRPAMEAAVGRAIATGEDYAIQYRVVTPAGELRWVEARGRANAGPHGAPTLMAGVSLDVTERKEAEERQQLLIRELHHRVKNTLATVQAIMGSTARSTATIEQFQQAFIGRIASLAKTHSMLTEDQWQAAPLRDLLLAELDPYSDASGHRVQLRGPDVVLPSDLAVPLGMAVHELTTNAIKHGSLSELGGRLLVTWAVEEEADGRRLWLQWSERDGPSVAAPTRQGFGSQLLQRVLKAQVQAEVDLAYDAEGLRATFRVPLASRPG
jgi:PAS domain S-box-containing protein